jgi:hypothetical protein
VILDSLERRRKKKMSWGRAEGRLCAREERKAAGNVKSILYGACYDVMMLFFLRKYTAGIFN